jgi:catechol 2,3-dioxygenase-like lactoylglutathione lyase family enzyme
MAHIALAVRDHARSRRFYETYFEFDPATAWVAEDGVLLIDGPGGVRLALGETEEPIEPPGFFHFGFTSAAGPEEVRAFRDRLAGDGIEIAEFADERDYVSVKCRDPDGYVVEFAWEPDAQAE